MSQEESRQDGTNKRKRARLACQSCRIKKQRCDGAQPRCSVCQQQGLECVFESATKKADVSELLLTRVTSLEDELHQAKASLNSNDNDTKAPNADTHQFPQHQQTTHPTDLPAIDTALDVTRMRSNAARNALDDSAAEGSIVGNFPYASLVAVNCSPNATGPAEQNQLGISSTIAFVQNMLGQAQYTDLSDLDYTRSGHENNQSDIQLHTWPQRMLANRLVGCYLEFCHPQYPFIHAPSFQRKYEALWTTKDPLSNKFAGIVNVVFALGCDFSGELPHSMGQMFFQRAKALIEPTVLETATLEALQALVLLGLYLQSTHSLTQSWNVIGMASHVAQNLGLHLKNSPSQGWMTPLDHEVRKRTWWACYLLDSVSCVQTGRPHMMSDDQITVDLPLCVDDEYITDESDASLPSDAQFIGRQPSSKPSQISFMIATIQLCRFMRDVHHVYEQTNEQWQILDIDQRICDWSEQLPMHLRPSGQCSTDRKLWRQREVLISRIVHLRLLLHRPSIAQYHTSDPSFKPFGALKPFAEVQIISLRAETCAQLAVTLIAHIAEFYDHGLNSAWWYDLNYLFSAVTVLIVHTPSQAAEPHRTQTVEVAIGLIKGMRDRGKPLAARYLQMLENFREQISRNTADAASAQMFFQDPTNTTSGNFPTTRTYGNGDHTGIFADPNNMNDYFQNLSFPWAFSSEDFSGLVDD